MLKNYLKIAYRNLLKNKVFSLINILGLAIGMAACLLILLYVRFELSYENFHQRADQIYRITLDVYNGSEYVVTDAETYGPLGPLLKEQMPEVVDFVRMYHNESVEVKSQDEKFYEERVYFADSSVFDVFSMEVLQGEASLALQAPFKAVITSSLAEKFFGHTDVIGKRLEVVNQPYEVSAVIADLPPNTHLKFDMLLSHTSINQLWDSYDKYAWNQNNEYTYLLMTPGTDLQAFNQKLAQLSASMEQMDKDVIVAEPIKDIHLHSNKSYEPEVNGEAELVYFLLTIALFIFLIACVNYINLSTARAMERSREVGVRKVMGSLRHQLVLQFMLEAALISLIAAGLALTLVQLSLPLFRELSGIPLQISILHDSWFWKLLIGLTFICVLLSGFYPSFVLSAFRPSLVLKGKLKSSSHGVWLRKGMVVFQYAATVVLITGSFTAYLQIRHLQSQDLGVNLEQTLALQIPGSYDTDSMHTQRLHSLKNELLQKTAISEASISSALPGQSLHELSSSVGIHRLGKEDEQGYTYYILYIDENFISTMDLQLLTGRNFDPGQNNRSLVLLNEEAVQKLGFRNAEEAIGSQITLDWYGKPSTVIGVLKNYHQRSPKEAHIPMIFINENFASYLTLRTNTEELPATLAAIESTWQKNYPEHVFSYFFVEETYQQQHQADTNFVKLITLFSLLAILIASLGLLGLSSYMVLQRTKEIGIRKVLGASVGQMVGLLSKDFVLLVLLGCMLAMPFAFWLMQRWLDNYASRINLSWWLFALPFVVMLLISLITVSGQTIRAALAQPARSLRYE